MANAQRIEAWQASVTRCSLAARALNATIALYQSSGPDADAAWKSVTAAREAFSRATAREGDTWRLASGQDAQAELPGIQKPGTGRRRGRRAKISVVPKPEDAN